MVAVNVNGAAGHQPPNKPVQVRRAQKRARLTLVVGRHVRP